MQLNARKSTSGRPGFSLGEVLVAVAIVAVASAVTIPVVFNKMRSSQEASLAQTYVGLSQGIAEFKRATTRYPALLSYLTSQPLGTDNDICGNDITSTNTAFWRGPYATRSITTSGIVVGEYTIQNTLRFGSTATVDTLLIDTGNVEDDIVNDLESQFDAGAASATTGTIQYTTSAIGSLPGTTAGYYNLTYAILINSC